MSCLTGNSTLTFGCLFERVKRRRCEQFKKGADLPTGVYINVHEQGETQA
ncbi:MAG: hypothetical protein IJX30_05990 [Clostridia bacterium]|nr:hypothetical protein [Clostridia bacterium]